MLEHTTPQPVPPQAGQVPHDQQVTPPSGQGHVHALLGVNEAHLPGAHAGQNDHLLLCPLEGIHGRHLHGRELRAVQVHGPEQVAQLWGETGHIRGDHREAAEPSQRLNQSGRPVSCACTDLPGSKVSAQLDDKIHRETRNNGFSIAGAHLNMLI